MDVPARAQVVVVGGGFAGAATAYFLTRGGMRDVVVLEREAVFGYHASGRNAAMCRQLCGDDFVTQLAMRGAELMRTPPAGFPAEALLQQTGSLLVSARRDRLDAMAATAQQHQLAHEQVSREALLSVWPRLAGLPAAGAVAFPSDGIIDVHALLQGLVAGARAGGARFALKVEVKKVKRSGPGAVVETSHGAIETACVVNAAGAWAGELGRRAGAAPLELVPMQRHLFLTERVKQPDRGAPFVWYVDDDEFYVRPEGGGYLLSGCDGTAVEPCDARVMPGATGAVAEKLRRLTPWLAELGVARSWACLRTFAPDHRPVIGWDRDAPFLFWVAGLGGHGATSALSVGELAAQRLVARWNGG